MSLNLFEFQQNAVINLLKLKSGPQDTITSLQWKVFIMDKVTRCFIATLMKVGNLRQHGVTLNLLITTDRTRVPNVPAIYFVEPIRSNIDLILQDMSKHLYDAYYVNFSFSISSSLLEYFATQAASLMSAELVHAVVDRFLHFASLSPTEFSLCCPDIYRIFHAEDSTDDQVNSAIETIVNGLLSVIVTAGGVVPVIRCPEEASSPAHMIANLLNRKLKAYISDRHTMKAFNLGPTTERPCLVLVDRDIDLFVMTGHTWSYQTLVHDLFDFKLNRVILPLTQEELAKKVKPKSFDFDAEDQLWKELGNKAFPEASLAICDAFKSFSQQTHILQTESIGGDSADVQTTLASLTAVPELVMQKKCLDMHTTVAHRIVTEVAERNLDQFYEFEVTLDKVTVASGLSQLAKLLDPEHKGTIRDKQRAALCFFLAKQSQLTPAQFAKLKGYLTDIGASTASIDFVKQRQSWKTLTTSPPNLEASPSPATVTHQNPLLSASALVQHLSSSATTSAWSENLLDRTRSLFQNVRRLLPFRKNLPLCETVEEFIESKQTPMESQFLYLDPKTEVQLGSSQHQAPRFRNSFRQMIVFCVGGGTYVESHALQDLAKKHDRKIIYGSTEFVSPDDFLCQLEQSSK